MTRKEKIEQRPRLVSAEERVKSWRKISRRRRIIVRRVEETVALRFADLSSQRADATCQHRRKIKVAVTALTFLFLCVAVCIPKVSALELLGRDSAGIFDFSNSLFSFGAPENILAGPCVDGMLTRRE
jgi:hypothetical protein